MVYDVVIIGGGLAGLSAGLKLVNEGKKVAILEKHHIPGGYATNFKRKDKENNSYTFDVSLHGIGGIRKGNSLHTILDKKFGILEDIPFLEKPETATLRMKGQEEFDIPSNFEDYKNHLIKKYPKEKKQIHALFTFLMEVKEDFLEVAQLQDRVPKHLEYLSSLTLDEFLRTYTQDDELIEEFCFLWLYYGLPPKKLNAFYYILPWTSYHIGGTYYIKGGAGAFSQLFQEKIKDKGSEVFLSSEVIGIQTNDQQIVSVTTKKGDVFKASQFIIACDPNHILSMVDSGQEEVDQYKKQLESMEIGTSLTQLYLGIDCHTKDIGMTKGDYFIEVKNHEETYLAIEKGDYSNMSFGITNYEVMDPELNKEHCGVVTVIVGDNIKNWPEYKSEAYQHKKQQVTELLLQKAEKEFPGLRKHIKVMELGTPHTMKRYTNNSDGAVYGWSQTTTQGGFRRLSFKTPFKNASLAGSWANPGGGFEGAITSGVLCAERVLRKKTNGTVKTNEAPDMDIQIFMAGMAANVNSKKAKGLDLIYHFCFDEESDFYIHINHGKGKLLKEKPDRVDLVVHTTYRVWYDIAFCGKSGADALFDGEIRMEGPSELFVKIPELFQTTNVSDVSEEKPTKVNTLIWVSGALVPWILYWVFGRMLQPSMLCALVASYVVAFSSLKPKGYKELGFLEGGAILVFAVNVVVGWEYFIDVSLIALFLISLLVKRPLTGFYSRLEYGRVFAATQLFYQINVFLTGMWTTIFFVRFLIKMMLPYPINEISYGLIVLGLIISYLYPKKRLVH